VGCRRDVPGAQRGQRRRSHPGQEPGVASHLLATDSLALPGALSSTGRTATGSDFTTFTFEPVILKSSRMPRRSAFLASVVGFSLSCPPVTWGADKPTAAAKSGAAKKRQARKPAVPSAAWEAMEGHSVTAVMNDGSLSSGRLAGIKGETATLIDADGIVRTLDISDVAELREGPAAPPPAPSPAPAPALPPVAPRSSEAPRAGSFREERQRLAKLHRAHGDRYTGKRGTPMYVTGIGMSTFGVLAIVTGGSLFGLGKARESSNSGDGSSLVSGSAGILVLGVLSVAIGVPLMVVGERRRDRYHAWLKQQPLPAVSRSPRMVLAPVLGPVRGGWSAGISVGF